MKLIGEIAFVFCCIICVFAGIRFNNYDDSISQLTTRITALEHEVATTKKENSAINAKLNDELIPQVNNTSASVYGREYIWYNKIEDVPGCNDCHGNGMIWE